MEILVPRLERKTAGDSVPTWLRCRTYRRSRLRRSVFRNRVSVSPPLAWMLIRLPSRSTSAMSSPTISDRRMPVLSSSSSITRSRAAASPLRAPTSRNMRFRSGSESVDGDWRVVRRMSSPRAGLRSAVLV